MPRGGSGDYHRHRQDDRYGPRRRDRSRSRSRDRDGGKVNRSGDFDSHSRVAKDAFGRDLHVDSGRGHDRGNVSRKEASSGSLGSSSSSSGAAPGRDERKREDVREEGHKKDGNGEMRDNEEEDEDEMMRLMGFGGFGSSKGKHVADNDKAAAGAANITKQRKYRQYMNRKEGFNTALKTID